jgi:hypothetical protein
MRVQRTRGFRARLLAVVSTFLALAVAAGGNVAMADPSGASVSVELTVDAKATGMFGPLLGGLGQELDPNVQDLVTAAYLFDGDSVTISATGLVVINTADPGSSTVGPDGIDVPAPRFNANIYFPLEESSVDNGTLHVPLADNVPTNHLGGLFGAFVPVDVNEADGLRTINDDPDPDVLNFGGVLPNPIPIGDVPSDSLFPIGSGPFSYTAGADGLLLLGVNDAYTPNNSGAFAVSLTLAPRAGNNTVICHKDKTMRVNAIAVTAHIAHGDIIGTC